ncbi:penicillin-binding protein 2 [Mangrovibacterium diazotrophicum]|uniref:Penicillin-binding protein 2 n=1 Tax=Mangrovibacterium diazotrophicum TaxID=1261403 RepID=A0A419VVL5_9BACT|nr:penicillin-binding protein 2 [Mangrovibacterium diazotrophicum]RKD86173.1 penicillin-binding protein 2 [Mangrovibacterium diazotrophicum]
MDKYAKRKYILGAIFVLVALIFIFRLFSLQVLDSSYKQYATKNVLRKVINYPARGLIYDRNGELLVYNKAAYDLLVTPREVSAFDTTQLCSILKIEKNVLVEELRKAKKYSRYKPSVIVKQLSPEMYAMLQEKLYKYPGFFVQTRTLREYAHPIAAHMLGYVGEVNQSQINKDPYYEQGDYIGITGIERAYEKELRGHKGVNFFLVDVHNRLKGAYNDGNSDTAAVLGNNLTTTIDAKLQAYCELLMQNKRGAVVAIEPKTGEILCFYSGPDYDANLLVGRERSKNYQMLLNDTLKPLTNRAISAAYSPGSTFKTLNALIALEEGAITENTSVTCYGKASSPIRCTHNHESPIRLQGGIRESCNPYFWNTFKSTINKYPTAEEGYNNWREHILSFGLGQTLGTEFYGESAGNIPQSSYYDRFFGKKRWNALTVRSLSIGQGEIIVTPLQMANMVSVIANRGYYIDPHIVKSVTDPENEVHPLEFARKDAMVHPEYFEPVIDGMLQVVDQTNTRYTAHVEGIEICGKTGTIQNSHGSDHSAFIAFAPKDNPQIAIAAYVENGVWGARYAAPIASLMIEKYLNDSIGAPNRIALEKKMIEANLLNPNQPK